MKNSELCVPLKALALPGESGGDVSPAAGDEVDFTGTATVSRIEGEGPEAKAYLTPKTINGETVQTQASRKPKTLDDEEADMRDEAAQSDRLY